MLMLTAIGRLTKDPEIKTNQKGTDFICFDLAVNKGYGDNQTTTYVSCCGGGNLISPLSKAKKGSLICISGELSTQLYQKKDGGTGESIRCYISSFSYINAGKKESTQQNTQPQQYSTQDQTYQQSYTQQQIANMPQQNSYSEVPISDGDLPF